MDIAPAISALGAALDLLKTGIAVRDDAKITDATQALQKRIIELQNACIELQQKYLASIQAGYARESERRQLEEQAAELRRQMHDRAAHKLVELAPGTFAYAPTECDEPVATSYRLCQPCMDNRLKKSVLQRVPGNGLHLLCPECETQFQIAEAPPFSRERSGSPMSV